MKNKSQIVIISFVMGLTVMIAVSILTGLFKDRDVLFDKIAGTLISAVITSLITYFLLKGQAQSQENKDKNIKVFEKKQEAYHKFLENIQTIIQDGGVKIEKKIDELKNLIFQLGYLQMHTSEETMNGVLNELEQMIICLNDYNSTEEHKKQKAISVFYSSFSEAFLKLVSILKKDLYGQDCNPIAKDKIGRFLSECGLYVENNDFDKYEVQNYFWTELRKQLKVKGYNVDTDKNFEFDVKEYYAHMKNRHRWYGFSFEVYKLKDGTPINFKVEVGNQYLYGFYRENDKNESVAKCLQIMPDFKPNTWWYGFRYSTEYPLDFFWLNSQGFKILKYPRKREKFIVGIANEIDRYIKDFQKIAMQKGI